MRNCIFVFLVGLIVMMSSCRKDFEFEQSTGDLEFSKDTVYLDTVFTNIGSSTYTLKVYNRSDNDIEIPVIKLGKGTDSKYRITVDGMTGDPGAQGKIFSDVELLANDSLYIFIETTAAIADADPADFLYTDQIQFDAGTNLQTVELVTLIQDAVFLYPQRFDTGSTEFVTIDGEQYYGFYLDENDPVHGNEYLFTNDKPYVIYGYASVAENKTLTIEPGARIHFHDSSGMLVENGASIQAIGDYSTDAETMENEIIFEGDRLEPLFSDVPGQWGAIWFRPGAAASELNHVTIKNGAIGLFVEANSGQLTLKNTQIYDHSNYGILAQNANIYGENVVINTAGQATLLCVGGSYLFKHSTFNNNWASSRQLAVRLDNFYLNDNNEQVAAPVTQAEFDNCIIYGSNQIEFLVNRTELPGVAFEYILNNCLIRFNNSNNQYTSHPDYQFTSDPSHYNAVIRNQNPEFFDIAANKLNIAPDSPAAGQGSDAFIVPLDIVGENRTSPPDLGAYKAMEFPEEN